MMPTVVVDGREWTVRPMTGEATTKAYRCPHCQQYVTVRTPHIVAWPTGQVDDRRHWHTPCWRRWAR